MALVLVSGAFPDLRSIELAAETTLYLVAGLTVASGLHYIYLYSHRKVREELREPPASRGGFVEVARTVDPHHPGPLLPPPPPDGRRGSG